MHSSKFKRSQNATPNHFAFELSPMAAACAALFTATTGAAFAQQAADAPSKIVVTGIRGSIETSIATKRNSDSIVEAVTAEDIGKLPDTSITESLARLPGLTAQRVEGRAQVISIRGLAPKYAVTLLNGREMVSTGDNRAVEYDQFPSELMSGATVYKTPDAALGAQGLSGTVNLMTVRPLDYPGRHANVSARAESNSNGSLVQGIPGNGNRLNAAYIDQFANRTIGVALGFARLDSISQQKYYNGWQPLQTPSWGLGMASRGIPDGTTMITGFDSGVKSAKNERTGLMGVLEFKPSKNFHSTVDLYYSKFNQKTDGREFQTGLTSWSGDTKYTNTTFATVNGDKFLTGYTVTGLNDTEPKMLARHNERNDKVFALGWNNELKADKWTLVADLNYSKADRDEVYGERTAGPVGGSTVGAQIISSPTGVTQFLPVANAAGQLLNWGDPNVMGLKRIWDRMGWDQFPKVRDDQKGLRLSAKRDLDFKFVNNFEGGFNYTHRTKNYSRTELQYDLPAGATWKAIPSNVLQSSIPLPHIGIPSLIAFDFNGATALMVSRVSASNEAPGRIWGVDEKVSTLFAKLGLEADTAIPLHGNVGVQVVNAKQSSTGLAWDSKNNVAVPETGGKSYTDVLPSLNLIADLPQSTKLRLGIAKVVARPNMEDMRAGFSGITVTDGSATPPNQWKANGGNPQLDPWRAKSYDLSLEKYIGKRSYVAFAAFRKDVKSSVYSQKIYGYNFAGFPNTTTNIPASNFGELTAPANGTGGAISGTEFSLSLEGNLLHPMLDGFGVVYSKSNTSSNMHEANDVNKPLEGLSGIATNTSLYYEKHGFSARVSSRYRSQFQSTARGTFGDNTSTFILPEKIMDAQVGYDFSSGSLKGLSVLFQVSNLKDEPYRVGLSSIGGQQNVFYPGSFTTYGRQYLLGANYKFF